MTSTPELISSKLISSSESHLISSELISSFHVGGNKIKYHRKVGDYYHHHACGKCAFIGSNFDCQYVLGQHSLLHGIIQLYQPKQQNDG